MPIYEYRCDACGRRTSLFFRSMASVDASPSCPRCGEQKLRRRMSRVWSHSRRGEDADQAEPWNEQSGVPFYGDDPESFDADPYGPRDDRPGEDEGDVTEFAREARAMAAMMGEPLDPDLDKALRHVEEGADPEDVFGEMDEAAEPDIENND